MGTITVSGSDNRAGRSFRRDGPGIFRKLRRICFAAVLIGPVLLLAASAMASSIGEWAPQSAPTNSTAAELMIRPPSPDPASERAWPRWVSLNPSLTAIIFRLGAAQALVGVDDYSAEVVPEAAGLPRVGGLFDPNLESVVGLAPDRVLIVAGATQERHGDQLRRLGLEVEVYPNERLEEVLENIARLGRGLDREAEAEARIREIRATRDAVARARARRSAPGTIAIVDRSPLYLVGGETFLDEMLEAVGARNLVRSLANGYPRGSIEWLVAAQPDLVLDMTPGADGAAHFWSRWPSLPAVQKNRVLTLEASRVSMPGPDLDLALRELATVVHGPEIEAVIDRELESGTPSRATTVPREREE